MIRTLIAAGMVAFCFYGYLWLDRTGMDAARDEARRLKYGTPEPKKRVPLLKRLEKEYPGMEWGT